MTRGDVVELKPGRDRKGREQRGRRFGVVVQSDLLAGLSTVLVAPTSLGTLDASFHVPIQVRERETRVMVEQLRSTDSARLGRRVGTLDAAELRRLDEALRLVLGLI